MIKIWNEAKKYWKSDPSSQQYELWKKEMQRYDYAIIVQGFELLKREKRFFPTTSEWLAFIDSVNDVRRDKEFQHEDRDAKAFWHKPSNNWQPVIRLLNGKITRGQFLTELTAQGFDISDMEHFYEKQGLPLDMTAGSQDFKKQIPEKYRRFALKEVL
ncbi:MAG: hypothetical protein A2W17_03545 [Planctomycetes bacterium RBG_16_41_13]|nr:MAG: hypothetical protein A2W17_03545 [Planctomycetes bacterium RBG_16_41_13]